MEEFKRKKVNLKTKENLEFQVIEWFDEDVDDEYSIKMFGIDSKGQSVCCTVNGFKPYFFVKVPNSWGKSCKVKFLQELSQKYGKNRKIGGEWVKNYCGIDEKKCKILKKIDFYGFRNGEQDTFIKLVFYNLSAFYTIRKEMTSFKMIHGSKNISFDLYESNLDPILRFVHDAGIQTAGWVNIAKFTKNTVANTQIDIETSMENVEFVDKKDISPIRQASFDIECFSHDGSFPSAQVPENVIYQIATTFKTYGDKECFYKNILSLKNCPNIIDPEGIPTEVMCFETEAELLLGWKELIKNLDPDILYQYNGDRFDGKYIGDRVKFNEIDDEFYNGLGKFQELDLEQEEISYGEKKRMAYIKQAKFSSGAYGTSDYDRLVIPGRINFDVLIYIQREFKLDSYKLDNVAYEYLKQKKNPVSVQQIFDHYRDGDPEKIKEIAEYCLQDTILPQRLVDKLDILPNQLEMAKVTYVPFKYLVERGQQIKVFSQIARITSKKGYVIPVLKEKPCGEVFKDKNGQRKVCKEKARYGYELIGEESSDILEEKCEDHRLEGMVAAPKFKGATVLEPLRGAYFEPVTTLDFASLYPSIMRAHNMCYSTFVMDPKYDNIEGVEYESIEWEEGDRKYCYKYVQDSEVSILPGLLSELYNERKAAKKMMAISTDPFVKSVYNGKQLALKVSMNSIYGFLAANMITCKPIAASVTAMGRQMIEQTKNYVETKYPGSVCIYGDSVTKETPVIVRNIDTLDIDIIAIEDLHTTWGEYSKFKPYDNFRSEKQQTLVNYEVWSDLGWTKINRVIRHKCKKKIYRVITKKGVVEVSEDHSLVDNLGNKMKVKDVKIGESRLMQNSFKQ